MRRIRKKQQGGFAIIVVVVLVALLVVMGVTLLRLVRVDMSLVGQSRRNLEAKQAAEGAAMEVLNDLNTNGILPDLTDPDLMETYTVSPQSVFNAPAQNRSYTAQVNLMRMGPMNDSSLSRSRAMVYEIQVTARYGNGASTADVRAEVYRPVTVEPGIVLPRRHFR